MNGRSIAKGAPNDLRISLSQANDDVVVENQEEEYSEQQLKDGRAAFQIEW